MEPPLSYSFKLCDQGVPRLKARRQLIDREQSLVRRLFEFKNAGISGFYYFC